MQNASRAAYRTANAATRMVSREPRFGSAEMADVRHIELRNVPVTATPGDLRRLVHRSKAQGVSEIALMYDRFAPTQKALITVTLPDFVRDNIRVLDNATLSGFTVHAAPILDPIPGNIETGSGPRGGLKEAESGKSVILSGIPIRASGQIIDELTAKYELDADSQHPVVRIRHVDGQFSASGRFLVRLKTTAEAHRLVRDLHQTQSDDKRMLPNYPLKAHVVY